MAMRAFEQPGTTRSEPIAEPSSRPIALSNISTLLISAEILIIVLTAVAALQFDPRHVGFQILAEFLLAVVAAMAISGFLMPLRPKTIIEQVGGGLGAAAKRTLVVGLGALLAVAGAEYLAVGPSEAALGWLPGWGALLLSCLLAFHLCLLAIARRANLLERVRRRIAVFGQGRPLEDYLGSLAKAQDSTRLVVACADLPESVFAKRGLTIDWPPIPTDRLESFITESRHHDLDEIVLCLEPAQFSVLRGPLTELGALPAKLSLFMGRHNSILASEHTETSAALETLTLSDRPLSSSQALAKRVVDLVGAGTLLLLLAPCFLVLAALIKLDSPGPVFFAQPRRGYNQFVFRMIKFRTMRDDHSDHLAEVLTTRDDPRVTRIGRFMRRTSLDELPQLLNVLRGDMSLVGPRPHPLLARAGKTLYQEVLGEYSFRSRMKPGMTGWAQIHGWRGTTETEEQLVNRIRYDLEYVDQWSMRLDFYILWRTLFVCAEGENAY
jgi:exopolysaccharide biosynthesis polyprenyl glycosylphosphotransferase